MNLLFNDAIKSTISLINLQANENEIPTVIEKKYMIRLFSIFIILDKNVSWKLESFAYKM